MELRRKPTFAGGSGGERHAVMGRARSRRRIVRRNVEAVHEVEPVSILDAVPEGMRAPLLNFVPAHMRYLELVASRGVSLP